MRLYTLIVFATGCQQLPLGAEPFNPIEVQEIDAGDLFDGAPSVTVDDAGERVVDCERQPDLDLLAACDNGAAIVNGQVFSDVDSAIDAAGSGSVVWVCPGVHPVQAIVSELTVAAVDPAPGVTVLEGEDSHRIFNVSGSFTLDGLELTRGFDGYDGGAITANDALLGVVCSLFTNNVADNEGGAMRIQGGETTILESEFRGNYAGYAGGAIKASDWSPTRMQIEGSLFIDNEAEYDGGALAVGSRAHDRIILLDVDFSGNRAGYAGGAVELGSWERVSMVATGGLWSGNHADYSGGALELGGWQVQTQVELTNLRMEDNTSGAAAAIDVGSRVETGLLRMDGVAILRNISDSGPAVSPGETVTLECTNCDFGTNGDDNLPMDVSGMGALGSAETFTR